MKTRKRKERRIQVFYGEEFVEQMRASLRALPPLKQERRRKTTRHSAETQKTQTETQPATPDSSPPIHRWRN